MMTSFDNNEDKVYLLLKNDIGRSRIELRARSHVELYDHRSCDHGVTLIDIHVLTPKNDLIFYLITFSGLTLSHSSIIYFYNLLYMWLSHMIPLRDLTPN